MSLCPLLWLMADGHKWMKTTLFSSLWLAQKVKHVWLTKASQLLPGVASPPPCNYHCLFITAGKAGAPAWSSRQRFSPWRAPNLKASLYNLEVKTQLAEQEERRNFRARINPFVHLLLHSQVAHSWLAGHQGSCSSQGIYQVLRAWLWNPLFSLKTMFACFSGHLNVMQSFIRRAQE